MTELDDTLARISAAALRAGAIALAERRGGLDPVLKGDLSPVTQADRLAEASILDTLAAAWPHVPVVAEEAYAAGRVPAQLAERFFLVDPIDGTREFIAGRSEFTVNIALIEGARPVLGVVFAPALDELFVGSAKGAFRRQGSETRAVSVSRREGKLRALASRSHRTEATERFLATLDLESCEAVGSSLKFCRLAEGAADVYPCFGPTMEWDTAAGQAVLEAAGGHVADEAGRPLSYGKRGREALPDFRNPFFVATGGVGLDASAREPSVGSRKA